jgi:copper chaperone NosL
MRLAALAAALLLVGCAGAPDDGPPTVYFGQDVCARCSMIVSEESFATAVVTEVDGRREALAFDDIGCLFDWEAKAEQPVAARWVSSHDLTGWVKAESAWFARSADIRSPMGSGVAAFGDRAAADRLAGERAGTVTDWNGLREAARTEGLLAPPPSGQES